MKQIIAGLLLIASATAAQAQRSTMRMGVGYQRTWMVDKQASPLKYQSSEKTFSLEYHRRGAKSKFNVGLTGSMGAFFPTGFENRKFYDPGYNADGSPKRDSSSMTGTLYTGRFSLGYTRKMHGGTAKNDLQSSSYLGGSVSNQLFYSDNIVRTGWLNASTFNADYLRDFQFKSKHLVEFKISIPLFGIATRLPYHNTVSSPRSESDIKTFFRRGSRFTTLADLQNLRVSVGYTYAASKKLGIGVQYFGQWLRYSKEEPVTLFQNNIGLNISIK